MAVARAVANLRSRTITDGDNLCLDEDEALLLRRAPGDLELLELELEELRGEQKAGEIGKDTHAHKHATHVHVHSSHTHTAANPSERDQ